MGNSTVAGTSFAGGLLKGIAQGVLRKKEEERQKPLLDLQKQKMQMEIQRMKSEDKKRDLEAKILEQQAAAAEAFRKSPLYDALMGAAGQKVEAMLQPPEQARNVGIPQVEDQPATPMGQSVTQQMAQSQVQDVLGSMTPMQAVMGQKFLGYDFPKALGQQELFKHYDALEQQADERLLQRQKEHEWRKYIEQSNLLLKTGETRPVQVPIPGGGTKTIFQPKYAPQDVMTKKPKLEQLIAEKDLPTWRHPSTGAAPPAGMKVGEAQDAGYLKVPLTQIEKINKIFSVQRILDQIRTMMEATIPRESGIAARLKGGGRLVESQLQITERGENLAKMRDFIKGVRAQLAKALGEVGNLTELEQQAVVEMLGAMTDTGSKAWKSFELVEDVFENTKAFAFGKGTKPKVNTVKEYKTAEDVREDYKAGLISKERAMQILKTKFGYK